MAVITGTESKNAFLRRTISGYEMYRYVNTKVPENSRLLFIYMKNFGFLCDRPFYSDSMFESYTIQKILSEASDPRGVLASLKDRGFTHLLCDMRYVYGPMSTFTPAQRTLFRAFEQEYLSLVKADKEVYRLYEL